ncbi:chromosome condensation protein CrcB [Thioclava sp. JM3]|uniref:fluoride efflux transporter CrcB n=1 Tax=Thioclava sp. JM3 TaxID=1973004 RepID=UPI000B53D65E|nr:fluoride efflux transporter CrcB [Thioclava sp. JM3]OWY17129.1 chromosome condensation protein CrcB [Thioclava sp. JM3]
MADLADFIIWVAVGSAIGGATRFLVSGLVARAIGETFPWGTMTVNVSGAFVIGLSSVSAQFLTIFDRPEAWPLAVTGFLGSYTTVSSFTLQTLALVRDSEIGRASVNVLLTLCLCLGAVTSGALMARWILSEFGA